MSETKRKEFSTAIAKTDRPLTFVFTISTGDVDRQNDTIAVGGWDLAAYRKSPVVLFGHDYSSPPVAKATAIGVRDNKLVATIEFPEPGVYARSDELRRLVESGFLNATSVGFRPITWKFNDQRGGCDFLTQELLEFSLVSVPANSAALIGRDLWSVDRQALSKFLGVDLDSEQIDLDSIDVGIHRDDDVLAGLTPEDVRAAVREAVGGVVRSAVERAVPGPQVLALDDEVELDPAIVRETIRETISPIIVEQVARAIRIAKGRVD